MERRFESFLKGSIKPVSIKETQFILEQMKTCVCRIYLGSKKRNRIFYKSTISKPIIKYINDK